MRQILKASLVYTGVVFGAGFVLGTLRVLLVVPGLGVRRAELLELPLMILVSFLAARFVTSRGALPVGWHRVAVGSLALLLLLLAEAGFVLAQGLALDEYVASRDPVSGSAYLLSLLVFALMPVLVNRVRTESKP